MLKIKIEKCYILSGSYFNLQAVFCNGHTVSPCFLQRSECTLLTLDTFWDCYFPSAKCLLFLTITCVNFFICSRDVLVILSLWSWCVVTHEFVQLLMLTTPTHVLPSLHREMAQNCVWVIAQFFSSISCMGQRAVFLLGNAVVHPIHLCFQCTTTLSSCRLEFALWNCSVTLGCLQAHHN